MVALPNRWASSAKFQHDAPGLVRVVLDLNSAKLSTQRAPRPAINGGPHTNRTRYFPCGRGAPRHARPRTDRIRSASMAIDQERLNQFLGHAVGDLGAAISATLMLVGDQLGLYKALASSR